MFNKAKIVGSVILSAGLILPTQVLADQKPANANTVVKTASVKEFRPAAGMALSGGGHVVITPAAPKPNDACKAGDKQCSKKALKTGPN